MKGQHPRSVEVPIVAIPTGLFGWSHEALAREEAQTFAVHVVHKTRVGGVIDEGGHLPAKADDVVQSQRLRFGEGEQNVIGERQLLRRERAGDHEESVAQEALPLNIAEAPGAIGRGHEQISSFTG